MATSGACPTQRPAVLAWAPPRCTCPRCACRLEEVYLVYTSEKNRGLTLRLHFMLIAAWAVGALKTLTQCAYAFQQ